MCVDSWVEARRTGRVCVVCVCAGRGLLRGDGFGVVFAKVSFRGERFAGERVGSDGSDAFVDGFLG